MPELCTRKQRKRAASSSHDAERWKEMFIWNKLDVEPPNAAMMPEIIEGWRAQKCAKKRPLSGEQEEQSEPRTLIAAFGVALGLLTLVFGALAISAFWRYGKK